MLQELRPPMKSGLCRSRQDKPAWKSSWPRAHTAQAKGGKVEGEAAILKEEGTCLRLQGRSVAQAGPKELSESCPASRDLDLRDDHE